MRTCDSCGIKLPAFRRRNRLEDGSLVCDGCHPDKPGAPGRPIGLHGSLSCQACASPMGPAGLVKSGGLLRCADGCPTRKQAWIEEPHGEVWTHEVEGVGEAVVRDEGDGTWSYDAFNYDTLPARTEGTASSLEEAKQRSEEAITGGQMTLGTLTAEMGRALGGKLRHVIAHDSGDGKTVYHCPFCGAGQTVARSDGTVECGFCHTYFTVQVQPEHSSMPQTDPATGQPLNMPGMPGNPAEHQAPKPTPTQVNAPAGTGDFAPAGTGGPDGFAPAGQGPMEQFAPAGSNARAASKVAHDANDERPATEAKCQRPGCSRPQVPGSTRCSEHMGTSARRVVATSPVGSDTIKFFLTGDAALPESSYIRHLAIKHADDRDAVLQQVRNERAAR